MKKVQVLKMAMTLIPLVALAACGQANDPSSSASTGLQAQVAVQSFDIDFEGLPAGTIPDELSEGAGLTGTVDGTVGVYGYNPPLGATNAAVIFDSANPTGGDVDLGTPNETCVGGGPGVGDGGELGEPHENCVPQGNLLIIDETLEDSSPNDGLVDDPNDADNKDEYFLFDFSDVGKGKDHGTVTVDSVTIMDVEADGGEDGTNIILSGPHIFDQLIAIPPQGDNGIVTISGIAQEGVRTMKIEMNGSGAIAGAGLNTGEPGLCWITTGGFHNAGGQSGGKDFTFGGNVGPPSAGSWEVIDHNTGDNFHSNEVHIVDCLVIENTGPGQPGGKKGFTINKALFAGTGRLNGVDGYPFEGFVVDSGEPSGKKDNDPDQFHIVVYEPGHFQEAGFEAFVTDFYLDGGNVQIHPPTGSQ